MLLCFFIVSLMTLFRIAVPWPQRLSMKPTIYLFFKKNQSTYCFFWNINSTDSRKVSETGVFLISGFLYNSLKSKFLITLRTSNDIGMELGPVTKLDKRNMGTSKKLTMTSCREIVASMFFLWFMANLEQFRNRISDPWSVNFTFSLTVTFYLTKIENRTKKSLTELPHNCIK